LSVRLIRVCNGVGNEVIEVSMMYF
jgi:hypothetical protein